MQKLILAYLFGDTATALENAAQAEVYLDGVAGFINVSEYQFYDSLARLAAYPSATNEEQEDPESIGRTGICNTNTGNIKINKLCLLIFQKIYT